MILVGRNDELDILRTGLSQCAAGSGGVLVLDGPVGSGRTELLLAFCEEARAAGATVLAATGSAMERDFPLAVLHQLLLNAPLDPDTAAQVGRLLEEGALAAAAYSSRLTAPVVQGLCTALLRLAQGTEVVIAVDDAHDIDPQSLECLLFLARRTRAASVLIVLAERESAPPPHPLSAVELLRQPHYRRISLGLLTPESVTELLAARLGRAGARWLAADWHAISGGNPLLANALVDDYEAAAKAWSGCGATGVVIGEAFRRNLVSCLYRLEPAVLEAAGALAMLGEPASPELLGGVLGVGAEVADRALLALTRAGLLDRGWFRHPHARAEVLRSLDPKAQEELHRRAAFLLHGSDVEATRVARHLAAAGDVHAPWAAPILQAAAQQALDQGSTDSAVQWLRLAQHASVDERQRAEARAALIRIETRLDPGAVSRHIPWVVDILRRGHLDGRLGLSAVKYAFWHGRPAEAAAALDSLDRPDQPADGRMSALRLWLAYWYPGIEPPAALDLFDGAGPAERHAAGGLGALVSLLRGHDPDTAVPWAEQVLRDCGRDDRAGTLESLTAALTALLYADRADRAASWCEPLVEQTTSECSPMWRALFTAIRAQAALRLGAPGVAAQYARAAITQVALEGWGVAAGIPLAVLISAKVALGEFEHAARYLATPVPEAMFQTPAGTHYRYARGCYNLAVGRPEAALADFRGCAGFLQLHVIDLPGIAPWRLGAAEAYLQLGRPQQAKALAEEQLELLGARSGRTRGMTLRVLAAAGRADQRPALLEESVEILHSVGDHLELARTLADLGAVYHDLGESGRARTIERRALHLKQLCLSETAQAAPSAAVPGTNPAAASPAVPGPASAPTAAEPSRTRLPVPTGASDGSELNPDLSDAERRVATMAARGMTNRQISAKLYITVSTVEQHLTRIYRKLGVSRRSDLPTWIEPDLVRGR